MATQIEFTLNDVKLLRYTSEEMGSVPAGQLRDLAGRIEELIEATAELRKTAVGVVHIDVTEDGFCDDCGDELMCMTCYGGD